MNKIANASRHALAYVREETRGVTPANPAMKYLRHTGCALNLSRDALTSAELRRDRQISDVRTLMNKIAGSIGIELSFGEFDELLEGCLAGTWENDELTCGVEERSFTFERGFTDIEQYVRYRGCYLNKFSLSIKPNAMITASFEIIGLSGETADVPLAATPAPSLTHRQYDSFCGELRRSGELMAVVTGIDLSLDNGINPQFVIFQRDAPFVSWGKSNVTGTMTAFFQSAALIQEFLDETPVTLQFTLGAPGDNQYVFTLPKIRYTGAENNMDADGPLSISMPFSAALDPSTGTNLIIRRVKAPAADTTPPTLHDSSPANTAMGVDVNSAISLTFNEPVKAGTGNITISNGVDDTRAIAVADAVINGATVTVTLDVPLDAGTTYHVNVDSTAITDATGNAFAGISDDTTLAFTTA